MCQKYLRITFVLWLCIQPWLCDCAHLDDISRLRQENGATNKYYCGKYLTEALATLCEGNYQTLRPVRIHKKSYWKSQLYTDLQSDAPYQNLGRRRRRRVTRGVYNECCEKPCSIDQLMMYCAAPAPSV
ncbi:probable insulin-like peptide 3 [Anthonomus grandis grandis]|uniref:probable insulin-like peptide 3 n=1 Tax=Anthonomus grandis grandis TaxID=2921223 RepID=UPI002165DA5C|nr:probable insulin-like peptide 3 [Anthonomus grandis grandis]